MADEPQDSDNEAPNYPESRFLIRLWTQLDAAEDLSVSADVLQHLDEIAEHCVAAIAEIRAWRRERQL